MGTARRPNYSNAAPGHAPKTIGGIAYQYVPNGNLRAENQHTYGYNAENRLISVATGTIPSQGSTLIQ